MLRNGYGKAGLPFLFALLLGLAPLAVSAQTEIRILPESAAGSLDGQLEAGLNLERGGRWGEAISHYENLLREFPNDRAVEKRLEMARLRYDLSRRYNDGSYCGALATVSAQEALEAYSEVLLKINAHYVTMPRWHEIVARGTTLLDVALSDTEFLSRNLPDVERAKIDGFRDELYRTVGQRAIRSRMEAMDTVTAVARLAEFRLGLSTTTVAMEYACAAVNGLDTYSTYLTGDQLKDIYSQIEGNFVGLGVELKADNGALLLVHIIPGSPAKRAGLVAGDRIVAVDGQSTVELSTDRAASMLQGAEGSSVAIRVQSESGQIRDLQVRREHVEVPSVENAKIVEPDLGLAYLKITSFQKTTIADLDKTLWSLHRQGMRTLIIDLRGNPGGLLTASVEAADRFLTEGIIVSTRGRIAQEDYDYRAHRSGTWGVPLIVLIDGDSASASEIFAGAIHDNRRGTLIGARSYGKGSVQGIFPLNLAGAGVRLTTAKFFSPNGHPISKVGVQPDIVVRHAAKVTGQGETPRPQGDAVLDAAVEAARAQLARR
ncbi:MAG: S41 family peptidase [Planctomycetales bacterium]|nr:S41 family peptidase [Planctomycetales bacterium]